MIILKCLESLLPLLSPEYTFSSTHILFENAHQDILVQPLLLKFAY